MYTAINLNKNDEGEQLYTFYIKMDYNIDFSGNPLSE